MAEHQLKPRLWLNTMTTNKVSVRKAYVWAYLLGYRLGRGERGSAITEYGILVFFVAITAITALYYFGVSVTTLITDAEADFDRLPPPAPPD